MRIISLKMDNESILLMVNDYQGIIVGFLSHWRMYTTTTTIIKGSVKFLPGIFHSLWLSDFIFAELFNAIYLFW